MANIVPSTSTELTKEQVCKYNEDLAIRHGFIIENYKEDNVVYYRACSPNLGNLIQYVSFENSTDGIWDTDLPMSYKALFCEED